MHDESTRHHVGGGIGERQFLRRGLDIAVVGMRVPAAVVVDGRGGGIDTADAARRSDLHADNSHEFFGAATDIDGIVAGPSATGPDEFGEQPAMPAEEPDGGGQV